MKMDLETLAKIVEERVPMARATCVPEVTQIVVMFTNRPDVEVALLTPFQQKELKLGDFSSEELFEMVSTLSQIAENE